MTESQGKKLFSDMGYTIGIYQKGERVFEEGTKPEKLYVLLEGKIMISQVTRLGKRILLTDIKKSGEIFGEVYLFMEKTGYDVSGVVRTPLSREEMADYMNVTRPSLSRELGNMVKEGILALEGRKIVVQNQEALESYL